MILAKANQLAKKENMGLPDAEQIKTQFLGGWLDNFKKRWQLKAFKIHGEAGDVNQSTIDERLESIRKKVSTFTLIDLFICD